MNFLKFELYGVSINNCIYNRANTDQFISDKVIALKSSNKFEGKYISLPANQNKCEELLIDKAICLTTVDKETRKKYSDFWKQRKIEAFVVGISGTVCSVLAASGILTVLSLNLVPALTLTLPLIGLAITVFALALSCFTIYRGKQASVQLKKWLHPIDSICSQRKNIQTAGFPYLLEKKLIGTIVHQDEADECFKNWAKQFFEKYNKKIHSKEEFKKFFNFNPLSKNIRKYTHFKKIALEKEFDKLKKDFDMIKESTKTKCETIRAQKEKELEKNENARQAELNLFEEFITKQMDRIPLQHRLENRRKDIYSSLCESISNFNDKKSSKYYLNFKNLFLTNLNFIYDSKKRQIELQASRRTENLTTDKKKTLTYFSTQTQSISNAYIKKNFDHKISFDEDIDSGCSVDEQKDFQIQAKENLERDFPDLMKKYCLFLQCKKDPVGQN